MRVICLLLFLWLCTSAFAQETTVTGIRIDSLPESRINIPIQVNLRPFYALAEQNVDTVFTSENYPDGWIQPDCATRYKYHFRRSPLEISMNGTTLNLGFTGYYKIIGSTRACVSGTVISPWTPPCRCGFDEGERRVKVSFTNTFKLHSNYILNNTIVRNEPEALDKCSVCFWGQDITNEVMKGLKEELDASKKIMEESFGTIRLRPYIQQAWDMLNTPYAIPGVGYFALNPKKLSMQDLSANDDLLNINIGITATPVVSFVRPETKTLRVPNMSSSGGSGGFNIYLEAALQYDSLSQVINEYLENKRFELSEGLIKKHIIIRNAAVSADTMGNLIIKVDFTGSFNGTAFFTGKPVYDSEKRSIEVQDLDYDLKTKNLFLKTAKWLFNKKIINELKKYTSFPLGPYYDSACMTLNNWLSREWTKGITGNGYVNDLTLTSLYALPQHLLIRSNCTGQLSVTVSEISLNF